MPYPDWSEIEWHVYEARTGERRVRVMPRELSAKETRPGEKLLATVRGVSRASVLAWLAAGVRPSSLMAKASEVAEEQHAAGAADRQPNRYRELVAECERRKREARPERRAA